jgi:uracil-DNA glycosylase
MPHLFDPGYHRRPFSTLVADYPGAGVYPPKDFRVEWGPIFHRGRLDGSAKVLVIGQDPGAHESIARRILVGEAGQRVQGFLAKLGIDTSYVMVNTFLYSVYGQGGGERHKDDPVIAGYRNRWLDALLAGGSVEAVVALGGLADFAFLAWKDTPTGQGVDVAYRHITHPTYPESASAAGQKKKAEAMKEMLAGWNDALKELKPGIVHPDVQRDLVLYGESLDKATDLSPIPERDLPAGVPEWMRSLDAWAVRRGEDAEAKRATMVVTVPRKQRPWSPGG